MPRFTFYQKPTCTTCRKVKTELENAAADFESINYYETKLSKSTLKELLAKLKIPAADLLRKKEPLYRELGLDRKALSEDDLIRLMSEHPDLIERPIVVKGNKAVLARPAEKVREIL